MERPKQAESQSHLTFRKSTVFLAHKASSTKRDKRRFRR
jgi:hypothetical protein